MPRTNAAKYHLAAAAFCALLLPIQARAQASDSEQQSAAEAPPAGLSDFFAGLVDAILPDLAAAKDEFKRKYVFVEVINLDVSGDDIQTDNVAASLEMATSIRARHVGLSGWKVFADASADVPPSLLTGLANAEQSFPRALRQLARGIAKALPRRSLAVVACCVTMTGAPPLWITLEVSKTADRKVIRRTRIVEGGVNRIAKRIVATMESL